MLRISSATLIAAFLSASPPAPQMIGINVQLNQAPTPAVLADLGTHGTVLDVLLEINAVTMRAHPADLPAIQALPCVAGANRDAPLTLASMGTVPPADFSMGANQWSLDAIDVTDFGGGRSVAYDGEGVYVVVLDTGLVHNWREYFPEERIDVVHARAFGGGGGAHVTTMPNMWQHDTEGHGTAAVSVILGFRYQAEIPALPLMFNGVAPKATIIPICDLVEDNAGVVWSSTATASIVYATNLKISGELGDAPMVISMSQGLPGPDVIERAAIDRAIANGIVFVAAAGNDGSLGMRYPGAYAPVISAAAACWVREFPADDPTQYEWIVRDVPESDPSEYCIAPFSPRELPGQDLDVAAPGFMVPVPWSKDGSVDYGFWAGTSAAAPHVAGVAALMLQKNPTLTAAQIEGILEATAMPLPPDCRSLTFTAYDHGVLPLLSNHFRSASFFPLDVCWDAEAASAGLVQAGAALAATPMP